MRQKQKSVTFSAEAVNDSGSGNKPPRSPRGSISDLRRRMKGQAPQRMLRRLCVLCLCVTCAPRCEMDETMCAAVQPRSIAQRRAGKRKFTALSDRLSEILVEAQQPLPNGGDVARWKMFTHMCTECR